MEADDKRSLIDLFWKMYSENTTYARHHETQRSTVTNLILILAGATMTLISVDKVINRSDFPASIFLIGLGLFGAIFSEQHFARYRQHIQRSKYYRAALDKLLPPIHDPSLSGIYELVKANEVDVNEKQIKDDLCNDGALTAIKRAAERAYWKEPKIILSSMNPGSFHILWTGIHLIVLLMGIILTIIAVWFPTH